MTCSSLIAAGVLHLREEGVPLNLVVDNGSEVVVRLEYMEPARMLRCHLQEKMITVGWNDNEKWEEGGKKSESKHR